MVGTIGEATQIIAGPGTGKTTELVERIAGVLTSVGSQEQSIIACTFTRKAAEELIQKLENKVGPAILNSGRVLVGTIHSISLKLLRDFRPEEYLDWEVIADESQVPYVHSKLMMFGFDETESRGQASWDLAREISRIFEILTDDGINPERVLENIQAATVGAHSQDDLTILERVLENYDLYLEALAVDGLFDYATIQRTLLNILRTETEITNNIVAKYQIVFVDEYQDVNDAQNEIFGELSRNGARLVVVGDDDQSIYGFRGGKVEHLVNFDQYMKTLGVKTKMKRLEFNYRSTQQIVDATTKFIGSQKYARLSKNLKAKREVIGPNLRVMQFDSDVSEAQWIVAEISKLRRANIITSFRSIGILCTSVKNHAGTLKRALNEAKIPFQSSGSGDLFNQDFAIEFMSLLDFWLSKDIPSDERETKLLASLSAEICNPYQSDGYLKTLNLLITEKKYYGSCLALMYDLFDASAFIKRHQGHGLNVGTLTTLVHNFDKYARMYNPYGLYSYLNFLRKQTEVDYVDDENRDAVQILTIHRSKGLQFDAVYVISQNDRNKPNPTLCDLFSIFAQRPSRDDEESKRVLYVAMTRARNLLAITGSKSLEGKKKVYAWNAAVKNAIESGIEVGATTVDFLSPSEYTDFSMQKDLQPVLSYNAIRLYEICPLQYRFVHFDRLETVRIGGMQFGVNMHRIVEHLLRMMKAGQVPRNSDVVPLIDRYWRDLPTRPNDENAMFREAGRKQLVDFIDKFIHRFQPSEIAGIEEPFSLSIAETRITGRFDLRLMRNGANQIVDFKTGAEDDYSSQLNFYAACLRELSGCSPEAVGIYYLKSGEFKTIAPTNLDQQIERVRSAAEQIKMRDFSPTPGKHCTDCAYNSICEFSTVRKKISKSKK